MNRLQPFKLERYFDRYEFSSPYLLSSSDCEAFSLKEMLSFADEESLKLWNHLKLGYTESLGHPILRDEISRFYETISPDQVLVAVPEEGIFIAMNSLLEKGDHVVTTFPGYQSLYEIASSIGCEISTWTPKKKTNNSLESSKKKISWNFDVNDLKNLIRDDTKLIVLNFPHNPTGAILKKEELKEIIDLAKERDTFIFSDEMYRFLEYYPTDRVASVCDVYKNGISLFGLSKSFALPGLRIGWLTTQNSDFLEKFTHYKDYTTICNNAPGEILAIIALRVKEKIFKRNLDMINTNLRLLADFFGRYENFFEWYPPSAGSIAFPELKAKKSGKIIDISDFCLDLINKKGVMLLPSKVYDFEGNYFRVGFARKNMPEVLDKLEEYLDAL